MSAVLMIEELKMKTMQEEWLKRNKPTVCEVIKRSIVADEEDQDISYEELINDSYDGIE